MAYGRNRFFEILPGSITWTILFSVIILSFIKPIWIIIFVILFDLYWLVRVLYFVVWLFISWRKYRQEIKIPWMEEVKKIPNWHEIWHIVFLPTFRDEYEVVDTTLNALSDSFYPNDRMIVVLTGEERDEKRFKEVSRKIKEKFDNTFAKLVITLHPKNLPDEISGKGSNLHHAGLVAKEYIDKQGLLYDKIIVSAFDIDTVVHPLFFARLAHEFLTNPSPLRSSYQPLALYNNNIWETPSFSRVVANSTTFWLMTELARPERLLSFSSHSMPWQALVDVGFWQRDIVTEDSRISMQCIVHYHGDYKITPIYIPVSMDTCYGGTFWKTVTNQYKQIQRWGWSVEHIPYLIDKFRHDRKTPWKIKFKYLWLMGEGSISWATAAIIIMLSRLPVWVASQQSSESVLVQNAPFVLEWLMRFAMIGIIISALVNVAMLPPAPARKKVSKFIMMIAQWILLPITLIIFGSIPAIDSQTRLMFGKYLGFWSTEKIRK